MDRRILTTGALTSAAVALLTIALPGRQTGSETVVQTNLQAYMASRVASMQTLTNFSFGVYSDIHMSDDTLAVLTRAQWQSLLMNWRDTGNAFGIIVGDLGYGHLTDIDNVLSGPAAVPGAPPVFYSLGNHELDNFGKKLWIDALYPGAVQSSSWTTTGPVPLGNADHLYWSFNIGPYTHFIMLDGDYQTYDGTNQRTWQTFGQTQLAWLANDIHANPDKNILVFVHEPIDQQATGDTPDLTLNDKGGLIDLLNQHPLQSFVFSGHLHNLGGITRWRGITSVHVMIGNVPTAGVRVNVAGNVITVTGPGTGNVTNFDSNPMNQTTTINGQQVLRVAEDGVSGGNTRTPKMVPVGAENGVTPTAGTLMLKADPITNYSPRFISEQLLKIVPGMRLSYDLYLLNAVPGRDAVSIQPHWYIKDGTIPPVMFDQNWIPSGRRPRDGMYFMFDDDLLPLGGRASNQWYHRDIDLTPAAGSYADGMYLAGNPALVNIGNIYADNIRFTWPSGTVPSPKINVALASRGATATASSSYSNNYPAASLINGDRRGMGWGSGGGWNDGTNNTYPDWVEVAFNATRTIDEMDVFTVQDSYFSPTEPSPTLSFASYGVRDFEVQYWNGGAWVTVAGGAVTGNTLVWRQFTFPAVTTTKVRVNITQGSGGYSRLAEIEAYSPSGNNVLPTVSITSPPNGTSLQSPANVTLAANAADSDGTIASVSFYGNGTWLGADPTSPYTFAWTNIVPGTYAVTAVATDNAGGSTTSAPITLNVLGRVNVALAANGGTAIASSTFNSNFPATATINGDRRGSVWGAGGGWNDASANLFPDWLEVDFSAPRTIDEIDVFSVQDAYTAPQDPTPSMTFLSYGLRDFDVQYWNGSAWVTVPGGSIVGNNLVWRQVTFAAVTTSRVRVNILNALAGYSRVTEIEAFSPGGAPPNQPPTVSLTSPANGTSAPAPAAFTLAANASDPDGTVTSVAFYANGSLLNTDAISPYSFAWSNVQVGSYTLTAVATDNLGATTTSAPVGVTVTSTQPRINVAAAANGSSAQASSTYNSNYPIAAAINGDRRGQGWGAGGGWNDSTAGTYPDWLEVDFPGSRAIDEIDVFTVQDNYTSPIDPTLSTTFSLYGLQNFEIQYWTGTAWLAVPGGVISGNNLVWRRVSFAAITTTKIRVYVTQAMANYSRITEVEAWGTTPAPPPPPPAPAPVALDVLEVTSASEPIEQLAFAEQPADRRERDALVVRRRPARIASVV